MIRNLLMVAVAIFALTLTLFGGAQGAEAASYQKKAVDTAKQNVGVRYVWGGTSPRGFDCSGLVKYSFQKAGKSLPRTAAEMHRKGKKVSTASMKPGDLMFFSQNKASKPSHVAIYIGNGKMIHAETYYKKVVVASINERYWKARFIGAKRV